MTPYVVAGLTFFAILGVFALLARRTASDSGVDTRLTQYAGRQGEQPSEGKAQARPLAAIDAAMAKGKRGGQIARNLARADIKLQVSEFIGVKILAALAGGGFGAILGRAAPTALVLAALVGAVLFSFIPDIYVNFRAGGRQKAFNNQLGDTIGMLANSLRSGYSFLQSMELVSREAPAPMSQEFRRVVQEVGLGLSTTQALDNLLKRVPSEDLDLLITAVNIQQEVGGNLAQILEIIGHTIRERVRIKGEIMVLTAQGRISGYVITALPIGLAMFISLTNPSYMAPIFTFGLPPDAWCCFPAASIVMITVGYLAIMKIVDIEV
ncbi:MAG: type II secretion system F family protein [Roseiflexaceae bacterium]|nr:type II secretion system F family protein [Roseiflexaceae bacterium]